MEPYKFEQDIKNKLEKRKIKPSANSWEKLSGTLSQKEHRKNSKFLWIMGVAASVIGILFFVSIFLKEDTEKNIPTIVTSPELYEEEIIIKVASEELINEGDSLENIEIPEQKNKSSIATLEKPNYKAAKQKVKAVIVSNSLALKKNGNIAEIEKSKEVFSISGISFSEEQKIDNLISQIQNLKEETKRIAISDIDALLLKAQQELALQKIYDESVKTVDAYKLLQDVEADLDKSFRFKVLETLKLNYETMKTVIAQRND